MIINKLRYTFNFCGVDYVFRNKKLYQQPYFRNGRTQFEREIKPKANGYYLQGLYMNSDSIKRLLQLKEVSELVENDCPF